MKIAFTHHKPTGSFLVCRVAFDYVRKHGFDAVRVVRLSQNMGKVCASHALAKLSSCMCTPDCITRAIRAAQQKQRMRMMLIVCALVSE